MFVRLEDVLAKYPAGNGSGYVTRCYGPAVTEEMISGAEASLGLTLPAAYKALLRVCNGGLLRYTRVPTLVPNSWADDHVEIESIPGVGYERGIDSDSGAVYMQKEWGYPEGMMFLDGDGHVGVFLDYRHGGPLSEPEVAWMDMEVEPNQIITLAPDFAAFLEMLEEPRDED